MKLIYAKTFRSLLLTTFIVLFSMVSFSATYYVSNTGNDSNSGLSEALAWKTLAKVKGFTSFKPGDSILLKAGDLFLPPLGISASGTVDNKIVISSYGTGAKPEIRAYGEVNGWANSANWTLHSTGIYKMSIVKGMLNRCWINGSEKRESATLSLTTDYPWKWVSNYLYVKSPSNPATYFKSIVISNLHDYSAVVENVSNIEIKGLNFTGGYTTFELRTCNNIIIDNCEIGYRTQLYGLYVRAIGGGSFSNTTIRNNRFIAGDSLRYNYDRGKIENVSTSDAILLLGNSVNSKVYNNYIENFSHSGVYLYGGGTGNEIYSNFITAPHIDYARGLGADYTTGSNNSFHDNSVVNTSIRSQFNGNGLKVYNNIIDGVKGMSLRPGSGQGMSIEAYAMPGMNMEIYNNTIRHCANEGFAIWGSNTYEKSYNNIHDNNLIDNDTVAHVQLAVWSPFLSTAHNNTFSNNHLHSSASANTVQYEAIKRTVSSFNASTLKNGDVRSGNDAIIKYTTPTGILTVKDPSALRIEHNAGEVAKTIKISAPMVDSKGNKYSGSVTIPPYSSVILIGDLSTPVVPGSPTSVVATAGNESASVTFGAPASNGGSVITGYTLTSNPAGGVDVNDGSSSLTRTITGLTNGTAYTFTVRATNSAGTSMASATSNSVIPKAPVAVASTFTFTGPTSGNVNNASSSFTVTPNSPYTGTITLTPSGTGSVGLSTKVLTFTNSSTAQSFTITPTVPGSITLTPSSNGALTNPSNLNFTVNALTPDVPTSVLAIAGTASATVTFAAPLNNGGSAITGYTITSIPAGGTDMNAGSTSLTHTISGLSNGTAYTFIVKATNSAGSSMASSASNSVVPDLAKDLASPVITSFTVPLYVTSLIVPVFTFRASDNIGVTGYLITETSSMPSPGAKGWSSWAPSVYVFSTSGSKTLYAWVKDAAGNVSAAWSDRVRVGRGYSQWRNGNTLKSGEAEEMLSEQMEEPIGQIDVFPNPTMGRITVRFSSTPVDGSKIEILDLSGRMVASRIITDMTEEFNLDQQPAGIYLVKTRVGTIETTNKLILK